MSLLNVNNTLIPTDELVRIRTALERIATCLERATEIPAQPPYPEKPLGPDAIGSYANHIQDPEEANDVRDRLRAAGLSDADIEATIVGMLADTGVEPTE